VRWFSDYLVVGSVAIVAVLLSAAAVAAVAIVATDSDRGLIGDAFASALAQLPAALLFLGVLALVFTVAPGLTAALGWSILGVTFFIGVFGPLLGLDDSVTDLSPFASTPVLVGAEVDWRGGPAMLAVAAVALVASIVLMRRRALRST
jgi:ABC-2 type transport system permease protein